MSWNLLFCVCLINMTVQIIIPITSRVNVTISNLLLCIVSHFRSARAESFCKTETETKWADKLKDGAGDGV